MSRTVRCSNPECGEVWEQATDEVAPSACPACRAKPGSKAVAALAVRKRRKVPVLADPIRQIGPYEVRDRLGYGAFGAVYRAFDPRLEREVALKVPHPGTLADEQAIARFLSEAKTLAKLLHPNIVPIHEAGRDGDNYFIASALIAGQSLSQMIPDDGMDERRAAKLVLQLTEALAHAHERGIVHRDVKPSNVLVDANDHLFLTDFGLAACLQHQGSRLTASGAVMGTPAYMAPEQARGETENVGPAADQYAVGVCLYQLLTGRLPFEGPTHVIIYKINFEVPPRPSELRQDIDNALEAICGQAMAARMDARFADCKALADALRNWLAQSKATAFSRESSGSRSDSRNVSRIIPPAAPSTSIMPPPSDPEIVLPPRHRRKLPSGMIAGGGIAFCLMLLGFVVLLNRGSSPRTEREKSEVSAAPRTNKDGSRIAALPTPADGKPSILNPTLPPNLDDRRFWRYAPQFGGGYVKLVGNGRWEEVSGQGVKVAFWVEAQRTTEYVELRDDSRNYRMRLGAGKAWIATGPKDQFGPSPHGNWETALGDLSSFGLSALAYERRDVGLKGVKYSNAIFLHPATRSSAVVSYRLSKRYQTLQATVGINDGANGGAGSVSLLTFSVKADGAVIWRSRPLQKCGQTDTLSVQVGKVEVLTLEVYCPGDSHCAHAVWADARLSE